jgi:hypothetical protein
MRMALRILAVLIGFATAETIFLIWRLSADLVGLTRSGPLGLTTIAGWLLILVVGPFAVVQLWRLKESGRLASMLLSASALAYYAIGWLAFRGPVAEARKVAVPIVGNLLLMLFLLSPQVRRACQGKESVSTR